MGQIANMNEMLLTFDTPSNRTVAKKDEQNVTVKMSGHKKHAYVLLLRHAIIYFHTQSTKL